MESRQLTVEMSPKQKFHQYSNVTKTEMLPKLNCYKNVAKVLMTLNLKCYQNVNVIKTELSQKCNFTKI